MVHPETGETVYCRGYASASSPGYDLLVPTAVPPSGPGKPAAEQTAVSTANGHSHNQRSASQGTAHGSGNGRSTNQPPVTTTTPQQDAALNSALFGQRP
ncbi:MAG: hypothetical protein H6653_07970 [Ardenticatenaceae bacterium]|nr:hypothetical protein [Ardenticatenaceae bacterium]